MSYGTSDVPTTDLDLWADDVLVDPYPAYRRLRDLGPVVRDEAHDVWIVSRYDETRQVTQDWERFTSARGVGVSEAGNRKAGNGILTTDPPEHDALRKVLNRQFLPKALGDHQAYLDVTAVELVGALVERGSFETVTELAQRYSIEVVSELTGLPQEGREHYMRWAADGFNVTGPDNERCQASWPGFQEMIDYSFNTLTPEVLAPDGWGRAIHGAAQRDGLHPMACSGLVMAIVWAGMDTTVNTIASAVQLFGRHPEQWQRLRDDRSLLSSAMAEVLRIEPPVQRFTRAATTDVEVGGVTIPEGSRVVVLFGSANRDERRFVDPDRFDIGRNPTDHLTFGRGIHRCVGAPLAQQELRAVLEALLDRVEGFSILEEQWRRNNGLHGLDRLVVEVR